MMPAWAVLAEAATGLLVAAALLPSFILLLQVLLARMPAESRAGPSGLRPRAAVLMPAHDEARGIGATLRRLLAQIEPGERVLVVADNCADDTATIAADEGAEVIERRDPDRRGKGYALDFGVRHLEADPPEVVLILDADCELAPGALAALVRRAAESSRPVQGLYVMLPADGANSLARLSAFAWLVRNKVRPLGWHRLGLPCQLNGTGMAFPWQLIRRAALASDDIVEDLSLGLELARQGTPPLFCPEAMLTSRFPETREAMRRQRTRWEHGHLGMLAFRFPRLLVLAIARRNAALLAMLMDLLVPPLALLALISAGALACAAFLFALEGGPAALLAAAMGIAMLAAALALAWLRHGRGAISLADLLSVPRYLLWKAPVYAAFLFRRQAEWVRTRRDAP
jgi:cellulose synthase/poly-beta-1,6-N-acetylglucosamine synthase-like glycosyltransferase